MERAVEVFVLESRTSASRLVDETWWARSEPVPSFISVAAARWEMVVTRQRGAARLTVRGPETRATAVPIPQDAEFFGITFSAGTFMPRLPPGRLVDRAVTLAPAGGDCVRLDGRVLPVPWWETADGFVEGLVEAGVLVHDPVVGDALHGDVAGFSTRSLERRVARATGLNRGTLARIRRAEQAVELLSLGVGASEVAAHMGYADQPHMTRSLKRLVGQTPARIAGSRGRR